ncbi:MAG: hypothetical protein VX619_09430 [bacterium]|nr:hypothetical protein [bacterium]
MLKYSLLVMISILLSPLQAIEVKTDFNSFYEEEQDPYASLLKLLEKSNLPSSKNLPIWLSESKVKASSIPAEPSIWINEKLGMSKLEKLAKHNSLIATEFLQKNHKNYLERKFFIEDAIVGKFEVSILDSGRSSEQSPVLLALHGHGGSASNFMDVDFIEELVSRGTIVVLPNFRAMRNLEEVQVSQKLFSYGLSLMGVRIRECINILKLVEKLYQGKRRIGLVGHSGGSAIARLLAWIVPSVKACAIDYESTFRRTWINFCCEGLPELYNKGSWIRNTSLFPVPLRKFPYNFVPENEAVLEFFINTLKPTESGLSISEKEVLPSKLQIHFEELIKKPSKFSSALTTDLLNHLATIKIPLQQDSLLSKTLKYSFLLPVEEQPVFLFKKLNTPASKLNFFSHLSAISGNKSIWSTSLTHDILQLIEKYPEGSQRNIIISHTFQNFANGNPQVALDLLLRVSSMVKRMGITGTRLMSSAGLITLQVDADPSKSLHLWPVNLEEKIILGSEWTCLTMKKDLKSRLMKQMSELLTLVNKNKTLVPYPILQNLVKPKISTLPEPVVRESNSGEDFLIAMLRVGKIYIKRNRPNDAASLARWFFDPEKACFYLSELAENVSQEKYIKILVQSLEQLIKKIEQPLFRVPFFRTLLRFAGDRAMHDDFKKWFEIGLQLCLKTQGSFDRLEPKYTLMLQTASEYGYPNLVLKALEKLPDPYFLNHILGTLLDEALEFGNVKMAESILLRYQSFKSRQEFLQRMIQTRSKYESIGYELGESFLAYTSIQNSSEEFDLDRVGRALDDYRGHIIQAKIGGYLENVLIKFEKRSIGRQELKVLIEVLKLATSIGSNSISKKIENRLSSIFSATYPEDWQNIILDWIEILIQQKNQKKADELVKKLTEPEVRIKYLIKRVSDQNISKDQFEETLRSIKSLDDYDNQATLLLDFAENQVDNHQFFETILNELKALEQYLQSEMRIEVYSKACSILIENGYTREAFKMISLTRSKLSDFEEDLRYEALKNMFSLARDLNNSALCFQILKQLLKPLHSEQISNEKLRIISELIINFEEDPFPLEPYLVKSLQRILVEKILTKESPCSDSLIEDESLKNISYIKVLEKCIRFLQN